MSPRAASDLYRFYGQSTPNYAETGVSTDQALCPQWDSNPHFTDFKSAASANWAIGAKLGDRITEHRCDGTRPLGTVLPATDGRQPVSRCRCGRRASNARRAPSVSITHLKHCRHESPHYPHSSSAWRLRFDQILQQTVEDVLLTDGDLGDAQIQ